MASLFSSSSYTSRYLLALFLLNLYMRVLDADPNVAFDFNNFGKDSNFESLLALYGDATKVVYNGSLFVQIVGCGADNSTAGRVVCKKPFRVVEANSSKMMSFSSDFVFSLSGKDVYGLAFVMFPLEFPLNDFDSGSNSMGLLLGDKKMKFLAIEFDTFKDETYGDVNDNHVGVDVESLVSVKVSNVSSIDLKLNDGEKLQAWIDYEASSKRFEVRLSKLGHNRPLDPLLTYPIDLSNYWNEKGYLAGLSCSSGKNNTSQCNIYSWSYKSRTTPHWMHSQPMDPANFSDKGEELKVDRDESDCASRVIFALIFGMGSGAMGALFVLFLWAIFGNRRPIVPDECPVKSDEFEYKKFNVVVDNIKTIEDGKK